MLILTRNIGTKVMIGDEIEVIVLDVKGKQVRLGISAPREVEVHREEIYHRIQNEKMAEKLESSLHSESIAEAVENRGNR